jgi:beta-phosphoglucomutase-like phosphatase (HAD superfamily)
MGTKDEYVLGVDLDGVCADFYPALRPLVAEWLGRDLDDLPEDVSYGLPEWGLTSQEYARVHRWAVTERNLFGALPPIDGAAASLRRLSNEGIRIRIITHRLFIPHFHKAAIAQTVEWLDHHGFPYKDLCFMEEKGAVGAHLYVEDSPGNIDDLRAAGAQVLVFSNSTNRDKDPPRADNWPEVETFVLEQFKSWKASGQPQEVR